MGKTVLACYDKLNPNAFKADLFRYSVVYTYGGCYLDIGIVAVANLRSFIRATDTFVSTPDGLPPHVNLNAATFCSTAKNPILDVAMLGALDKFGGWSNGSPIRSTVMTCSISLAHGFFEKGSQHSSKTRLSRSWRRSIVWE